MPRNGFIKDKLEVKFLVLFILNQLKQPVTFSDLAEISMCDEAVGYFEFSEAAAELLESGHMLCEEMENQPPMYTISDKGIQSARICESSLPYSVKMAAQRSLIFVLSRIRRDTSVKTKITESGSSCTIGFELSDEISPLLALELIVPTRQQAEVLQQNFKQNAVQIYNAVLDAMLRDYSQPEPVYGEQEEPYEA